MQANCFVDAGESLDTLLVPIEAVFEQDGRSRVEILREDGTVEAVFVTVGLMNDKQVEILDGLEESQLVITGSTSDLLPSQQVNGTSSILPGAKN